MFKLGRYSVPLFHTGFDLWEILGPDNEVICKIACVTEEQAKKALDYLNEIVREKK